MTAAPIYGVFLSSRYSPEFLEGFIAFSAAVLAVAMLPVWPGIRDTLASRSRRFATIYFTVLIGLVVLTALLVRDILTPDQSFRRVMVIAGLILAVVALPVCFVASLRSKGQLGARLRIQRVDGPCSPVGHRLVPRLGGIQGPG